MLFVSVLALSVSHSFDSSPKGGSPWQNRKLCRTAKALTWERWHGVSRDGEGKPASKRQIYEKALSFKAKTLRDESL